LDCAGTTNAHDDNYWHYAIVGSREQGLSSTGDPQSTAAATRSRFCHFLQQSERGETIYAPDDDQIWMHSQGEAAGECSFQQAHDKDKVSMLHHTHTGCIIESVVLYAFVRMILVCLKEHKLQHVRNITIPQDTGSHLLSHSLHG